MTEPTQNAPATPSPETASEAPLEFWKRVVMGLVVGIFITAFKIGVVEKSRVGRQIELAALNIMQERVGMGSWGQPNVVVVDITSMPTTPADTAQEQITQRKQLFELVQQVAAARPKAIGVDIFIELGQNGFLRPDDSDFLSQCQKLKNDAHIPIFVGVYQLKHGRRDWLDNPELGEMGAAILIPHGEDRIMPVSDLIQNMKTQVDGVPVEINSLSWSLVEAAEAPRPPKPDLEARFADRLWFLHATTESGEAATESSGDKVNLRLYRVDYGAVDKLKGEKIPSQDVPQSEEALRSKIVLIGRATTGETSDQFNVAARGEPVPGVLIHAAGVATLLGWPLYTLGTLGNILLDVGAVLLFFLILRICSRRLTNRKQDEERFEILAPKVAFGVALAVLVIGWVLNLARLQWTDFIFVAIAVLAHGPIEDAMMLVLGKLKTLAIALGL